MIRLSTKLQTLLVFGVLALIPALLVAEEWPVKQQIDLSTGFGDYLPGHFHGGVDIRTGGREGTKIFSPVDGYVWRLKMAYGGSGKTLYLKSNDGHIYMFGHLSRFADDIDGLVTARQVTEKIYKQDFMPPPDSIKVRQGDLIAFSGQSGSGGPHIHFEKRTPDNQPVNPLINGFKLKDEIAPSIQALFLRLTDDSSFFTDGTRQIDLPVSVSHKSSRTSITDTPYLHRPFGVLAECFDRSRQGGMKLSVRKVSLYFDGELYYESRLDTADFAENRTVALEYDFGAAITGQKRIRRLYKLEANPFRGSRPHKGATGVFGLAGEKPGRHQGRIVAEDCSGHKSELKFDFYWGPRESILRLDKVDSLSNLLGKFIFEPIPEFDRFDVDSIVVFRNRGLEWKPFPTQTITRLDNGNYLCRLEKGNVKGDLLRLHLFTSAGTVIEDEIFNGVGQAGKPKVGCDYEVTDEGLMVTLTAGVLRASETRLELYYKNELLGIEYPQLINMKQYVCLIKPQEKYRRIDRIGYTMTRGDHINLAYVDSLQIMVVGFEPITEFGRKDWLNFTINKGDLYVPHFIEIRRTYVPARDKGRLRIQSDYYEILPDDLVSRNDFMIRMGVRTKGRNAPFLGLCWLDKKEKEWIWLGDSEFGNQTLTASSGGGGVFAAFFDLDKPAIIGCNIVAERAYKAKDLPGVRFQVVDSLSGIPENGVTVKFDGQWVPAEFDPERQLVQARPLKPFEVGEHHLAIRVRDRAGNEAEQYATFTVK